jgi:hypothetical protein
MPGVTSSGARRAVAGLAGAARALGGCGLESRAGQIGPAAAPARVDPAHPPMSWGGPDGRSALDGTWIERSDRAGRGEALGWFRGTFDGRPVTIPFSPNAGTVRGAAGLHSFQGSIAWYRTTFATAQAGDYALRFESVNHRATVWVDGRLVAHHTGVYLPFEAELSLAPGAHSLVVRADWRSPARMKATGWHRTWFNFGGINRGHAPPARTQHARRPGGAHAAARRGRDRRRVRRRAHPGAAAHRASAGHARRPRAAVRAAALGSGRAGRDARAGAHRAPRPVGARPPRARGAAPRRAGRVGLDRTVGLRELRWSGGRLRLNGQPLRLRGASLHEDAERRGDALVPADLDAIVQRLQAIGANATRAQHLLSPALLERLDAAGILVWQEIGPVDAPGNWTSNTPALRGGDARAGHRQRADRRHALGDGVDARQGGRQQRPHRPAGGVDRRERAAAAPPGPGAAGRARRVGQRAAGR